ncbi:MAG: hypothetical protein H0T68_04470 [Gemmatimonadales bacterium]|nr:hypothetical protein [Gemmatimonadales bacterium]
MTPLLAAGVGLMAGAHTATWGMYKDAPHEGFSRRKYARSMVLGAIIGLIISLATGLDPRSAADLVILFGATYAVERGMAELYKTFLREQDQSKYSIPMQFAIFGKVVRSRGARLLGGAAYAATLLGMVALVYLIDRNRVGPHPLPLVLLVGGLGGWISAFGGAWKDAPYEGFQTFKFFRSPLIASLYALGLGQLTDNLVLITLAATGFTVATTETYKTFFFPSKPRGKFAGTPVHFPEMLVRRQRYIALYVVIWVAVLGAMAKALVG